LGLIAGTIAAVATLGVFLSLRFYIASRHAAHSGADPSYVQDLESEIASLRASKAQSQTDKPTPTTAAAVPPGETKPAAPPVTTAAVVSQPANLVGFSAV